MKVEDNNLGTKMRFYRKRVNLSQEDVEALAGLAGGTISRIEKNKISPTKETLARISIATKLDQKETAYLFGINLYPSLKEPAWSRKERNQKQISTLDA